MKKEVNTTNVVNECVESQCVVIIESATERLQIEVGKTYKFEESVVTISKSYREKSDTRTTGLKTLYDGTHNNAPFEGKDSCYIRKVLGLEKRGKSAGKTFEYEGDTYSLDETTDKMIEGAVARYTTLLSDLYNFERQYNLLELTKSSENISEVVADFIEPISKHIEKVCLARIVAKEEAEKKAKEEAEKKAKENKEKRKTLKEAKTLFLSLLSSGKPFAEVSEAIKEKYNLQVADLI